MKKFTNTSDNQLEKALKKGFTVPPGAVNLAWVKSPKLNPKNNIVVIDTSKITTENKSNTSKRKKFVFANGLGILEDANGNQVWDEEYPIISDIHLSNQTSMLYSDQLNDEEIIPYLHVSRYFHLDVVGIADDGLSEYVGDEIKVVDKDGLEYTNAEGKKLYKVFLSEPNNVKIAFQQREILYRVYVFLDMDPDSQDLYLKYNKGELSNKGSIKNLQINYQETINPRRYFDYVPEETDVVDHSNYKSKIYSSKPAFRKEQIVGKSGSAVFGWKYFVPKKAIPDPRIFQAFNWRLACEFTESKGRTAPAAGGQFSTAYINAGILIPQNGNHGSSNANYLFHQLNITDYNVSNVKFINPLQVKHTLDDQSRAAYWHVDIDNLSQDDLKKFDVLVLAPSVEFVFTSDYISKFNEFLSSGKTLIIETSSVANISNMIGSVEFSPLTRVFTAAVVPPVVLTDCVTTESMRLVELTPGDETDAFNKFSQWSTWPPNISDIINNYQYTGSILRDGAVYSGWNLTTSGSSPEVERISAYEKSTFSKIQYIESYNTSFIPVVEASFPGERNNEYKPVLIHSKNNNGGNIFISTGCIFEDHIIDVSNSQEAKTDPQTGEGLIYFASQQFENIPTTINGVSYKALCSSQLMAAEMKLRINTMLYATLNKPSNQESSTGYSQYDKTSTTVYTDWQSSWVISGDVLSEEEKQTYKFVAQRESIEESDLVHKRILSDKSMKDLIDEQVKKSPVTEHLSTLSNRVYYIITTNQLVKVPKPNQINELEHPTAWTKVTSPSLSSNIGINFGTYAIKHEIRESSSYIDNQEQFPSRTFAFQTTLTKRVSQTSMVDAVIPVTIDGTYDYETINPPVADEYREVEEKLNWDTPKGTGQLGIGAKRQANWPSPEGIDTYTDANYYNKVPTVFPYMGFRGLLYHVDPKEIVTYKISAPRVTGSSTVVEEITTTEYKQLNIPEPYYQHVSNKGIKHYRNDPAPKDWTALLRQRHKNMYGLITFEKSRYNTVPRPADAYNYPEYVWRRGDTPTLTSKTATTSEVAVRTSFSNTMIPDILKEIEKTNAYSSKGKNVELVQMILNEVIKDKQGLKGPELKVDGIYGATTAAKVRAFQTLRKAYWIDGIVDSETWSLLGYSLVGLLRSKGIDSFTNPDLKNAAQQAASFMQLHSISDGDESTGYVRQSWSAGASPSKVSETFKVMLKNITEETETGGSISIAPKIHKISITPWLPDSKTKTVVIDYIHVGDEKDLKNFEFTKGSPGKLDTPVTVNSDEPYILTLPEGIRANCIIFRMTQTGGTGSGKSKVIGVKEVSAWTKVKKLAKKGDEGGPSTKYGIEFTIRDVLRFSSDGETVKETLPIDSLTLGSNIDPSSIKGIRFKTVVKFDNPNDRLLVDFKFVPHVIFTDDNIANNDLQSNKVVFTYKGISNTFTDNSINGPEIGSGGISFYTKKYSSSQIDTGAKTFGSISQNDGIVLICDENGAPFGFPGAKLLNLTDEDNIEFLDLSVRPFNNDQFTKVGLFDIKTGEFINSPFGNSRLSYYDYIRRGPQNIYIGVQTTYAISTAYGIPGNTATVSRPYSWVMPVYSISSEPSSKVQIQPMPESLGVDDVWPIPIKYGAFNKVIDIPSKQYRSFASYLNDYQGTKLKAVYNIPEANNTAWSSIFGRPYIDIIGEIPDIVDDYTIKVKYGSILCMSYPSNSYQPSFIDPWKPIFTVYKRNDLNSSWRKVPMSDIKDYNLWRGEITFVNPITSNDSRLIKVDYTCERKVYNFKYDVINNEYINLNPYINIKKQWLNAPLYVYMVPEYVLDTKGGIIEQSKNTQGIRLTTTPYIFDMNQVDYDPTAILIGIVYVSTSFDVNDLIVIDSRKRGGGISSSYEDKEMEKLQFEYNSYWDVVPSHITSYQKGGFVIIRLPNELKDDFTTEEIIDTIQRNISAGVGYKVEDLQGNAWES